MIGLAEEERGKARRQTSEWEMRSGKESKVSGG